METVPNPKKSKKIIEKKSKPIPTYTPVINKMRSYTEGWNYKLNI